MMKFELKHRLTKLQLNTLSFKFLAQKPAILRGRVEMIALTPVTECYVISLTPEE